MNVLDRIKNGLTNVFVAQPIHITATIAECEEATKQDSLDVAELLALAERGARYRWVDGMPPMFGPNEHKQIIIEYPRPITKLKSYMVVVWLGTSYSNREVQLAKRWMPLPEPEEEGCERI